MRVVLSARIRQLEQVSAKQVIETPGLNRKFDEPSPRQDLNPKPLI